MGGVPGEGERGKGVGGRKGEEGQRRRERSGAVQHVGGLGGAKRGRGGGRKERRAGLLEDGRCVGDEGGAGRWERGAEKASEDRAGTGSSHGERGEGWDAEREGETRHGNWTQEGVVRRGGAERGMGELSGMRKRRYGRGAVGGVKGGGGRDAAG